MLTGGYTPPQILERANNQWGLRTRQFKRTGGNPLARSSIYRLFTNLFYTGIIDYSGKHHPGNHDPMITFAEYDRVQLLLGRKGAPRRKRHAFAFTGFIRCGECGCSITAQTKTKYIKSEGETRCYTYYHCTRKRKDYVCSQRKYIREEELERQIAEEIGKYTILPEFRDWGLEILDSAHNREVEERSKVYETQHQTLVATQNQLDNLIRMKYKEMVTDEEYHKERNRLEGDIAQLKAELRQTENRAQDWVKLTEQVFDFATHAQKAFQKGDLQTKKAILMTLGQNPTITDGKLSLEANCWLKPIEKDYPPLEAEYLRLEPLKTRINKGKNEVKTSLCPRWRCVVDDVRTAIMAEEGQIYIPDVRPMRLKADDMMNLPHTL